MFGSRQRARSVLCTTMTAAMVLLPAGVARAVQEVTAFSTPYPSETIVDLAAVPGGIVAAQSAGSWSGDSAITGFSHLGTSTWTVPIPASQLGGAPLERIAPAADGSIWFTASDDGYDGTLGRITTTRKVTIMAIPGLGSVQTVTATADGRVYVVAGGQLRQLATDGTAGAPLADIEYATDLRAAPDGSVWWIDDRTAGRLSPTGEVTTYALPGWPESVAADAKGHAWFGAYGEVVSLDVATGAITRIPGPAGADDAAVDHLTAANDGSIWFSGYRLGLFGRVNASSTFSTWSLDPSLPSATTSPTSLVAGKDGNIWLGSRTIPKGAYTPVLTELHRVTLGRSASFEDDPATPAAGGAGTGTGGAGSGGSGAPPAAPASPTASPALTLTLRRVKLGRGVIRLPLQCFAGPCAAQVSVSAKIGKTRGVVLARKSVNTQTGKTVKLGLRLSGAGRKAVRRAGRKGLGTLVNVTIGGKTTRYRLIIKR